MDRTNKIKCIVFGLALALFPFAFASWAQIEIKGEPLDPAVYGAGYIESMEQAIERDQTMEGGTRPSMSDRKGQKGIWQVPGRNASHFPHSGEHYVTNKWGDTRMGISFPSIVDVHGAYFAGQGDQNAWTRGVRVIGYLNGEVVQETHWFRNIGAEPNWMAMDLEQVNRIEIVAEAIIFGGGWYAMDDLTYSVVENQEEWKNGKYVVDFDDLSYNTRLSGSGYAGLTWETGQGNFEQDESVHPPKRPDRADAPVPTESLVRQTPSGRAGTAPNIDFTFQGVIRGDAGSMSYPPDTDGAIGPDHYVITVNRNFAVYDKTTGAELINILLGAFLPDSNGDPRVVFDQHSQRWFVIVTDFSATASIFLAVSLTSDPTGDWFKTSFVTSTSDWPDYPTLGVDANGVYTAAYMVGSTGGMTIFAIDKAPLVAPIPHLGTVTAFTNLPWEGAIQPAHTYGTPGGEYLVSWNSSSSLRVRRIDPPLTAPTLMEVGYVSVPSFSPPPNAPALGSTVALNTVDERLMMSVYRDGSIFTAHTIDVSGRAGCRWYEIDVGSLSLVQWGNVADSSLYYFFPSIMVNKNGDVVMGFSGSNADQYAGCYYTGRLSSDPPGEMAPPVQYKAGTGPQNNIDSYNRNRWGDYSYTTLDPVDELSFWTLQEYGHSSDIWGTYGAVLSMDEPPLRLALTEEIPEQLNPGLSEAFTIEISDGAETYVPGTGKIHYRFDGGVFIEDNLTPLGGGLYEGALPVALPGDMPEFYFSAQGDGGSTLYLPKDAPATLYSYEIYFIEKIVTDAFESESGWTVQNTSVLTGAWERADPAGTDAQPEDDNTPSGTHCFVTGKNGGAGGDDDLDGGPTRLISPEFDLSEGGDLEMSFYLWFYHSTYGSQQPLEIHLSNNNGSTWTKVTDITHSPAWTLRSFKVTDYITPSSEVKIRFSASDNPNDDIVEALLDDFTVSRVNYDPSLWADGYTVSLNTGGVIDFTLDAGIENAGRKYVLLGSVSGTSPGFTLPSGIVLPLNWDPITRVIRMNLNSPAFQNFLGFLDPQGQAVATLLAVGPFDPSLVGVEVYFAYPLLPPPSWNFTSNAVVITLVL